MTQIQLEQECYIYIYIYGITDPPVEMYQKIVEQSHCRGSLSFQNLGLLYANFE